MVCLPHQFHTVNPLIPLSWPSTKPLNTRQCSSTYRTTHDPLRHASDPNGSLGSYNFGQPHQLLCASASISSSTSRLRFLISSCIQYIFLLLPRRGLCSSAGGLIISVDSTLRSSAHYAPIAAVPLDSFHSVSTPSLPPRPRFSFGIVIRNPNSNAKQTLVLKYWHHSGKPFQEQH